MSITLDTYSHVISGVGEVATSAKEDALGTMAFRARTPTGPQPMLKTTIVVLKCCVASFSDRRDRK